MDSIREEFPCLLPIMDGCNPPKHFHGFIKIGDYNHEIWMDTPHFPDVKGVRLSSDVKLHSIVAKCEDRLLEMCEACPSIQEYLRNFQQICTTADERKRYVPPPYGLISSVLEHLEVIGWPSVAEVSDDFKNICLETRDGKGRLHRLRLEIPSGYPSEEPHIQADLPVDLEVKWNSVAGLSCIFTAWEEKIESLQDFWDVVDELDEIAHILDPPNPSRKDVSRRILLSNHASVQLTMSVSEPSSLPQCLLLGATALTETLGARLVENCEQWDPGRSIVHNMEAMLGEEVVRAKVEGGGGTEAEGMMECSVCYCSHLDGALPDITCDHCQHCFHVQCVYEWLCTVPKSRLSLDFVFGDCPHCTKTISCKVPK